jgi:hypothetical protein
MQMPPRSLPFDFKFTEDQSLKRRSRRIRRAKARNKGYESYKVYAAPTDTKPIHVFKAKSYIRAAEKAATKKDKHGRYKPSQGYVYVRKAKTPLIKKYRYHRYRDERGRAMQTQRSRPVERMFKKIDDDHDELVVVLNSDQNPVKRTFKARYRATATFEGNVSQS